MCWFSNVYILLPITFQLISCAQHELYEAPFVVCFVMRHPKYKHSSCPVYLLMTSAYHSNLQLQRTDCLPVDTS